MFGLKRHRDPPGLHGDAHAGDLPPIWFSAARRQDTNLTAGRPAIRLVW
jgi:hypothetical protein